MKTKAKSIKHVKQLLIYADIHIWLHQTHALAISKWCEVVGEVKDVKDVKVPKCQSAKVNEVRMKPTRVINLGLDSCHLPWRCRGQAIKPCEASQNFWNTSKHFLNSFSACSASSASARRMNWGTCQTCHQLVFASWCHHCLQMGEFIDNWRRQRLHAANASVNAVRRCRLVSITHRYSAAFKLCLEPSTVGAKAITEDRSEMKRTMEWMKQKPQVKSC